MSTIESSPRRRRGWLPALLLSGFGCTAHAGGQDIPLAEFTPLPAASELQISSDARHARARFLGARAANPEYVSLYWYGVASFIVTIRGHLLLFDAWEIVGGHADYVPLGREDLAALEPEAILIGHGHFDHAADAGYVASRTGAVVVGSEEICAIARSDAEETGGTVDFDCAITGTMDTPLPGIMQSLQLFADLPAVQVLQHVHSAATPPGENNQPDPFLPVFDPLPYLQNPNTDPQELIRFLGTLGDAQGGTWLYHLRDGDFSLLIGDSAGPIFDYPEVQAALDSFPGCVDVMANAILGFDQPVSGLQDPVLYVEHAHPRVFLPSHGDAWAPVLSAGQAQYEAELRERLATLPHPPELDMLLDPRDYLAERSFRVSDPIWAQPMSGSSCAPEAAGRSSATLTGTAGGSLGWCLLSLLLALIVPRRIATRRSCRVPARP